MENLNYSERIHQRNKELISSLGVKVGDTFILNEDFKQFKQLQKGCLFKVNKIHPLYGWVLFEETESLPQQMEELLKIGYFVALSKGGKKRKWKHTLKQN